MKTHRISWAEAASFVILAASALPGWAYVTYDATATGSLKVIGIDHAGGGEGVYVGTFDAGGYIALQWYDGGGWDEATYAVSPKLMARSVGGAPSYPHSFAYSRVETHDTVVIQNMSPDEVTVHFEFAYELTAEVTATDTEVGWPFDMGQAWAGVRAYNGDWLDPVEDIYSDEVLSDVHFGGGLVTLSDTILFDHTTGPGIEYDPITALVETYGWAQAFPEPASGTTALMCLAWLVLFGHGRRPRNCAA